MKNFSVVSVLFSETHSICEYESTSIGGQSGVITVDEFTRQILQVKDFLKGELVHSIRNVISEESQGIEKRILENISKKLDRNVRSSLELESPNIPKRNSRLVEKDRSNRVGHFLAFYGFWEVFSTDIKCIFWNDLMINNI